MYKWKHTDHSTSTWWLFCRIQHFEISHSSTFGLFLKNKICFHWFSTGGWLLDIWCAVKVFKNPWTRFPQCPGKPKLNINKSGWGRTSTLNTDVLQPSVATRPNSALICVQAASGSGKILTWLYVVICELWHIYIAIWQASIMFIKVICKLFLALWFGSHQKVQCLSSSSTVTS